MALWHSLYPQATPGSFQAAVLGQEEREGQMTDATAGGGREAIEQRVVLRSLEDDAFRRQLLADPKGALEQELGAQLPTNVKVEAVEETPETVYLVLPARPTEIEPAELTDGELESVAGGETVSTYEYTPDMQRTVTVCW